MFRIGIAFDPRLGRTSADGRAIAALWRLVAFRLAVLLDKHGIIDVGTKGFLDRIEISAVAIRGELHAIGKTVLHVIHERQRIFALATDEPRARQAIGMSNRNRPPLTLSPSLGCRADRGNRSPGTAKSSMRGSDGVMGAALQQVRSNRLPTQHLAFSRRLFAGRLVTFHRIEGHSTLPRPRRSEQIGGLAPAETVE